MTDASLLRLSIVTNAVPISLSIYDTIDQTFIRRNEYFYGKQMKIIETKDGAIIEISVRPNAREFKLTVEADEIVVFSTEQPTKGRVNKQVVKELTRLFHSRVELVSGFSSREKRFLVRDVNKNDLECTLLGM
jgi:uncharacterized protein (TIGR00251 family)